jgi:hypothetical protein
LRDLVIDVGLIERRAYSLLMLLRVYGLRATLFTLVTPAMGVGVLFFDDPLLLSREWL